MAVLRELYGPGVEKTKVHFKSFKVPSSSKTIEITTIGSNYHIEINPSDVGRNDRLVVQEIIKEIAQTQSVNIGPQQKAFKVVVLKEVDSLSKSAQHALRRTMEKYMSTCRIIMCCESSCRIIGPVRSRVLPIRIPKPTINGVCGVLKYIAARESLNLPDELANKIALKSDRNLRRAILMLESCKVQSLQNALTAETPVRLADWERFIDDMGRLICEEQSPHRLLLVRQKLYELLCNCIPPEIVIKTLAKMLLKRLDDQLKHEVIRWAAYYEHRIQQGSKPIFHLEAFVAKFMSIYKRWIIETFS